VLVAFGLGIEGDCAILKAGCDFGVANGTLRAYGGAQQ
jgi:hypothetical protein